MAHIIVVLYQTPTLLLRRDLVKLGFLCEINCLTTAIPRSRKNAKILTTEIIVLPNDLDVEPCEPLEVPNTSILLFCSSVLCNCLHSFFFRHTLDCDIQSKMDESDKTPSFDDVAANVNDLFESGFGECSRLRYYKTSIRHAIYYFTFWEYYFTLVWCHAPGFWTFSLMGHYIIHFITIWLVWLGHYFFRYILLYVQHPDSVKCTWNRFWVSLG